MAVVRPLCAQDDFDEVGNVYAESWKACYRGLLPQAFLDKLTHDRWSGMLRADPSASLGVFEEGRIVGTAMVSYAREPGREGFGELVSLYLRPEAMGRGYGRSLMEAVLQRLREDGCDGVCLWVLEGNRQAQAFYRHMGFRASGRSQKELFGGAETALVEMVLLWTALKFSEKRFSKTWRSGIIKERDVFFPRKCTFGGLCTCYDALCAA